MITELQSLLTVQKFTVHLGKLWNANSYTALLIIIRCSPGRLSALCSTHVHGKQTCFFVFSLILQRLFKLCCLGFIIIIFLNHPCQLHRWKLLWEMQPQNPSYFMPEMRKIKSSEKKKKKKRFGKNSRRKKEQLPQRKISPCQAKSLWITLWTGQISPRIAQGLRGPMAKSPGATLGTECRDKQQRTHLIS